MEPLAMPRNLLEAAAEDGREWWLATLPETLRDVADRWSLTVGDPFEPGGQAAWVAPVVDDAGGELALKLAWRHPEAVHEADGLRAWAGDGAVRLFEAEDLGPTTALLIERCVPGTALRTRPLPEQDFVISGLLRRLWREPAPGHPFRPLQAMCDMWADEFVAKAAAGMVSVDPGLARDGMALFRELPAGAPSHVLLCTDLHAGNVLAAEREPWLVIDPKPYVGDPTYDALQHLLNDVEPLLADPADRIARMADLAGLDAGRLRLWLFARCVQESPDRPQLGHVARLLG